MKKLLMSALLVSTAMMINAVPAMATEECPGEAHFYADMNDGGTYDVIVRLNLQTSELLGINQYGPYDNTERLIYVLTHPTQGMRRRAIHTVKKACTANYDQLQCDTVRLENVTGGEGQYPLFPVGTSVVVECTD